jgi:hypothetical protein
MHLNLNNTNSKEQLRSFIDRCPYKGMYQFSPFSRARIRTQQVLIRLIGITLSLLVMVCAVANAPHTV